LKDLREIYWLTFAYRSSALKVIAYNFCFVVFNLLSLVLFIPVLQLIFNSQNTANPYQKPSYPKHLFEVGEFCKDSYNYFMSNLVKADPKGALMLVCFSVFVAFFLKNLFRYGAVWHQSKLRMVVVRDLRNKLFEKILLLPLSFHSSERRGDLMARMNSDVGEIEIAVVSLLELVFREPIAILINLVTLVVLSPELTLFSLLLLPVSALVISRINKSLKRTAKQGQEQTGLLFSSMDEALHGIRIIKAFGAIPFINQRFQSVNSTHQLLITKTFRKKDVAPLINETLGSFIMVLLVWFGGILVLNKTASGLSGEMFLTFIIVFSQLLRPIQSVSNALANMAKAKVSLDRIQEVLNQDERIVDAPNALAVSTLQQEITFDHVSFSYQSDLVLKNIHFSIQKGQTIAVVGESGSGKSTLMDLIPRFYDPASGTIAVDGQNIKGISINSLRSMIGIVAQDSLLFNGSVLENIAFGDPSPDIVRAEAAAANANALDFILQLEGAFHYNIGDRGNKLSGGQKQRISIARAIYKNPQILLLDEATSALDTESERLVQNALERLMEGKTSLIVAHRLSTVMNADRILVLSKGKIVEEGSHQDLLALKGHYFRLCSLQGIS
jgi:subfamily B ATP-binding cassette protein MsbA